MLSARPPRRGRIRQLESPAPSVVQPREGLRLVHPARPRGLQACRARPQRAGPVGPDPGSRIPDPGGTITVDHGRKGVVRSVERDTTGSEGVTLLVDIDVADGG